jgi:hypothetical protein
MTGRRIFSIIGSVITNMSLQIPCMAAILQEPASGGAARAVSTAYGYGE